MDSVSHPVLVITPITIFIPNAFTPNGDGLNDEFSAFGQNICDFEMIIYDRWGEEVFHSHDLNEKWNGTYNGKKAEDGVYSWLLWYKEDYRLYQMDRKTMKGSVNLIR
jgi:gliding motility-associated-like protein